MNSNYFCLLFDTYIRCCLSHRFIYLVARKGNTALIIKKCINKAETFEMWNNNNNISRKYEKVRQKVTQTEQLNYERLIPSLNPFYSYNTYTQNPSIILQIDRRNGVILETKECGSKGRTSLFCKCFCHNILPGLGN